MRVWKQKFEFAWNLVNLANAAFKSVFKFKKKISFHLRNINDIIINTLMLYNFYPKQIIEIYHFFYWIDLKQLKHSKRVDKELISILYRCRNTTQKRKHRAVFFADFLSFFAFVLSFLIPFFILFVSLFSLFPIALWWHMTLQQSFHLFKFTPFFWKIMKELFLFIFPKSWNGIIQNAKGETKSIFVLACLT